MPDPQPILPTDHRLPENLPPELLLCALADGELEAEHRVAALRHVAAEPNAARVVEGHVKLASACRRVLSDVEGPSDDLQRRVAAMAFQMPATADPTRPVPHPVAARSGGLRIGWSAAAVAAAVLIVCGVLVDRYALKGNDSIVRGPRSIPAIDGDVIVRKPSPIPAQYVSLMANKHVGCSKHLDHHPAAWPVQLASLEPRVQKYTGGVSHPDLSTAGYDFVGCGACKEPTGDCVHLIYKGATDADTVSLFIQPYDPKRIDMPPGACYGCGYPDSPHPVLSWRTNDLIFYLVSNGREPIAKVQAAMKLPAKVN